MFHTKRFDRTLRPRNHRGMTLVEVMISVAISSMTMMAVFSLMWTSGRAIKELYGQTRTRSSRMIALDQIKYRLVDAEIGSVVEYQADTDDQGVLIGYHRIDFIDPTNGGVTSSFIFNEATNTLTYDDNTGDTVPAVAVVRGPLNITFEVVSPEIVQLNVKTEATLTYGNDIDTQEGETKVYLRNTP